MSRGSTPIEATSGSPEPLARTGAARLDLLPLPADGSPALWTVRDADRVNLVIPGGSTLLVRTGDHPELCVPSGGAIVLVGHQRFAAAALRGGTALVLSAARAPIEALLGASCSTGCLPPSGLLGAATRFLRELAGGPGAGTGVCGDAADAPDALGLLPSAARDRLLREVIVAVLVEVRETEPADPHWLGLLDRAVEHIAGHRTDQELRTETLARSLNVSVRQLQRVFAATGSTPQREIRHHRAALAATLLRDRAFAALTVEQVAHQSGFHNAADMRRALACHELPSPRALRADLSPKRILTAL